jgi:hypothetical protein
LRKENLLPLTNGIAMQLWLFQNATGFACGTLGVSVRIAMKIKISDDITVESRTLIRLEWRGILPVLIVHEKYEKIIKWVLRIIAFIGIASSLISIDSKLVSLGVALLIFFIEQFFERTIFEYTTMVVQPLPDFDIDYGQWKTNGFLIPMTKNDKDLSYVGPTYTDKDYAIKFFNYLKSWNHNNSDDKEGNIVLSFVIEPNEKYTTYLYANHNRKDLDKFFKKAAKANELKKYGKKQQQFVMQTVFWHTLDYKEGYYIKRFLDFQPSNEKFYLTPSVIPKQQGQQADYLFDSSILKYNYKLKNRADVTKGDLEYHFLPA